MPRIGALGDTFHMLSCHEPWFNLTDAGDRLMHVHISHTLPDLSGRIYPKADDGEDYETVIRTLVDMGYKGDISVEAATKDFATDAVDAVKCLRKYL